MQLGELAESSGVPLPTIKYYLRQGLLPAGAKASATRAVYDQRHLDRLRLLRALVDGARLSLAAVAKVIAALDDPPTSRHELFGVAAEALESPSANRAVSASAQAMVERLVEELVAELVADPGRDRPDDPGRDPLGPGLCGPSLRELAEALTTAEQAGVGLTTARLTAYAAAMAQVGAIDLDAVAQETDDDDLADQVRWVAVGTIAVDPVILALRRLAQELESARRFGH